MNLVNELNNTESIVSHINLLNTLYEVGILEFNDFNKCVCDTDYITECFESWLDKIESNYDVLEEDCNMIHVKFNEFLKDRIYLDFSGSARDTMYSTLTTLKIID